MKIIVRVYNFIYWGRKIWLENYKTLCKKKTINLVINFISAREIILLKIRLENIFLLIITPITLNFVKNSKTVMVNECLKRYVDRK